MDLNQLFERSPTSDSPTETPDPSSPKRSGKTGQILGFVTGGLAVIIIALGITLVMMRPVTLRIAVGPANSDDAKVVQALAQAFSRQRSNIRLRPVLTDGAKASAAELENKRVDLAVIRGDLNVPKEAAGVAVLRKNLIVLWVPAPPKGKKIKNPIKKISNLAGRRIGVIGKTEANVNVLQVILRQYGVDPAKVTITLLAPGDVADAVHGQKIDALLASGPLNGKIVDDAIAASVRDGGEPTFLAIDAADAIAQNVPAYDAAEITAGSLGGVPPRPDDEIKTISFAQDLVALKSLSDTTVAALTRQIFTVRQSVISEVPAATHIETPDTDKDADIPAHPGAAAYVDGEEKTFLDRYSDFIWWGIMGLSAMGSAGAWFASYLKRDERKNNMTERGKLLEMLTAARRACTHEELDEMQAAADEILKDTLNCYDDGAIEEGSLTAFNIALDQFHAAIADRRLLLTPSARPVQLRA